MPEPLNERTPVELIEEKVEFPWNGVLRDKRPEKLRGPETFSDRFAVRIPEPEIPASWVWKEVGPERRTFPATEMGWVTRT